MDHNRWKRIRELFEAAADLSPADRAAFLESACPNDPSVLEEVSAMLEEDSRGGFLLDGDVAQLAWRVLGSPPGQPFREFGPYRIQRLLGEGGMGVVFLAERRDLGNQVAIKILRDGLLSPARLRRFSAEQRTLARLNHPAIARLYDADTLADGTPWFVMEYVDGVPVTEYCRRHPSPIEERLKLFRAVCEAVEYAHRHGVIHRDLKPSNILVKEDRSVRLLDFGIAKSTEADAEQTRTGLRLMTPAYASPEQMRGEPATAASDVYSLGVILYELLAGRLPFDISGKSPLETAAAMTKDPAKPSLALGGRGGALADLDVLCLTAMHKDPARRYRSASALIEDLDRYLKQQPLRARPDSWVYQLGKFVRRNRQTVFGAAIASSLILAAGAFAPFLRPHSSPVRPKTRTVAVLPLRRPANQPELDYLSWALPEEIARVLGYARSLTVRPFELSRRYDDPRRAGREMHAGTIVTGEYARGVDQLQVVLTAIDVETNRYFWRETFRVPAHNLIELQAEIAAKTRGSLGPLLGATEFLASAQPKNPEAYDLFLRASALDSNPDNTKEAIELFRKSLSLDGGYAPAWVGLAMWYRLGGWYDGGGKESLDSAEAAAERALSLDPNSADAARGLIVSRTGRGQVLEAYQDATEFLKKRPDNEQTHFALSYVLRYVGLLDESTQECEAAFLIDPLDASNRSCGVSFMLRGSYRRAVDFINLDAGSEWARTFTLETLLRQGKVREAMAAGPVRPPKWAAFNVLFAYLDHQSPARIEALSREVQPEGDAEANYLAAAHLAYAGQVDRALSMLSRAIEGGYCAYPTMLSDPLLDVARKSQHFDQVRAAGIACQDRFLAQRRR